jgi:alkylation response protein AidB-like acyl-CoA dehydrogenase
MDFNLTEEQQAFASSVRSFAETHLSAGALERAHSAHYPWDVARLLGSNGLLGITLPTSSGGQGGTLMDAVIAIQELASVCPKSADVAQAGNFGAIRTFADYAGPELRERYLPQLLAGDELIGLGMSEPDAGSALTELATSARADGESYIVDGTKVFSTNSGDATLFLVYVRFGPGPSGIGSVAVARATPGLTIGPPSRFMSGEQWHELSFDGCRIPRENLVLGPGGFKRQMGDFNVERIGNAARSLALGRYAFNYARAYALTRKQFGRPLCEFQGLQWKFADMAVTLEAAQLLLYRAAVNADRGLPSAYDTAIAKAAANLAGFGVSNEALQVMGGLGYGEDTLVEYCVRRTRGFMIAGGSIEMMKNRIAESLFERRFSQRI